MEQYSGPGQDGSDDEISLVDIIVILIRKRRLIIGVTLLGTALALAVVLGPQYLPVGLRGNSPGAALLRVLVPNESIGQTAKAMIKTKAFEEAFGRSVADDRAGAGFDSLTVEYDNGSRVLRIKARGSNRPDTLEFVHAAYSALEEVLVIPVPGRYNAVAEYLSTEASNLFVGDYTESPVGRNESELIACASATSKRMVAEAFSQIAINRKIPMDIALNMYAEMVAGYKAAESMALKALAANEKPAGALSQTTANRLNQLVIGDLLHEARLYRSIPLDYEHTLRVIDEEIITEESMTPASILKRLVLSFTASLFLGLFSAFISNAWDRIRLDPVAMGKLKEAVRAKK